jgi:hypothetical protein
MGFLFENPPENTGKIYFADSVANHTAELRHALDVGEKAYVSGDPQGGGHIYEMDLSDYWFDAEVNGEVVVISRMALRDQGA